MKQISQAKTAGNLLKKLGKKLSIEEYLWFGLASATGEVNTLTDLTWPYGPIGRVKKNYMEISSLEDDTLRMEKLNEQMELLGDAIDLRFKQMVPQKIREKLWHPPN